MMPWRTCAMPRSRNGIDQSTTSGLKLSRSMTMSLQGKPIDHGQDLSLHYPRPHDLPVPSVQHEHPVLLTDRFHDAQPSAALAVLIEYPLFRQHLIAVQDPHQDTLPVRKKPQSYRWCPRCPLPIEPTPA